MLKNACKKIRALAFSALRIEIANIIVIIRRIKRSVILKRILNARKFRSKIWMYLTFTFCEM